MDSLSDYIVVLPHLFDNLGFRDMLRLFSIFVTTDRQHWKNDLTVLYYLVGFFP